MKISILAAGNQDRFGGDVPKCLMPISDEQTIVGRIRDQAKRRWFSPHHIVLCRSVASRWQADAFEKLLVGENLPLGRSLSAAMGNRLQDTVVISGDTVMTEEVADLILFVHQPKTYVIFDPYRWITIEFVAASDCVRYKREAFNWTGDRIQWISHFHSDIRLVKYDGWWNVNTPEDLKEAERGVK